MKKQVIVIISVILVVAMCAMVLAACTPNSNPDKAKDNLKKKEYTVFEPTGLTLLSKGAKTIVVGVKVEEDKPAEGIFAIYYEDKASAKDAFETVKSSKAIILNALGVSISKDEESRWSFKQSGSVIWYGTEAGVKAAA